MTTFAAPCRGHGGPNGQRCEGISGHAGMCGHGEDRWWGANEDPQAARATMDSILANRRELDEGAQVPWLGILLEWALADDDAAPLDFAGAEVPPRVAMLLGRAFSDVGDWIGRRVQVALMEGLNDVGDLTAVHRDATGAPYALELDADDYQGETVTATLIPWAAIVSVRPVGPRPTPSGPDPWKPTADVPF